MRYAFQAFFQDGRTRIIAMDYTNRGNVFVEVHKVEAEVIS